MLLRNAVYTISMLIYGDRSTKELAEIFKCSDVSIKRFIAEARRMGANIEVQIDHELGYQYRLANPEDVKMVVNNWTKILIMAEDIEKNAKSNKILLKPEAALVKKRYK